MAKSKNSVNLDVNVKGKGVQKTTVQMKKLGTETDKAAKSTGQYNRNMKGASKQSSGASKNFSKMSQGMGGIVGSYAVLAANIFAIGAAFRFLKSAGDLQKLKEGQVLYASATGTALRSLTSDIRAATDAQITFTDASQAAAIGKAAGLTNDQLVKLGKGAKDVSIILGRDVTDSFNRLVRGVTKAEPELLDELGIILRLADASDKYATMIGKTANQLTQYEKSQAVTVEVLSQLEDKYGRIMKVMEPEGNQFTKLGVAFDDLVNDLKDVAQVIAGPIAATLTKVPALIVGIAAIFATGLMKSGIASWSANATANAKRLSMAYIEAQAHLANLQRTQAKKVATQRSVPAQAKKAMQGQNIFKSTTGKTYQKVMRGETLSKKDQGYINRAVTANKAAGITMSNDWKIALKSMSAGTIGTTQKIGYAFKNLYTRIKVVAMGVQLVWSAALKGISAAAAATGRVLTFAMSAVAWISIIATIAMTVKQLFAVEEQADKTAETLNAAGEKVAALNTEFSKFNEVQKIVTEDGENMLAFFESLGTRISQLNTDMQGAILDAAWEGFGDMMDPAQLEVNLARIDEDLREATASWRNIMGLAEERWFQFMTLGLGTAWAGIFSPDESEQFHSGVDDLEGEIERLIRVKAEIEGNMDMWDLEGETLGHRGGLLGLWKIDEGTTKETIEHMSHLRNQFRDGAEMSARLGNQIALLEQQLGPANDALAAIDGSLIGYLKSSKDVSQIELGKYYEDLIASSEIIAEQFGDAQNPVRALLDYFETLEDITLDGTEQQLETIKDTIASLTSSSNEWTTSLSNANRMARDNAQEVDKILLGVQSRSTEGRMEDTLKDELLERLRSSFPESKEIEKLTREGALAMVVKVGVDFMPSGEDGEGAIIYQKRNAALLRQIELFDMLDKRKDDAVTRGLEQTLSEHKALLGTTKLVGARIKLEEKLAKNRNKSYAIADERFEIEKKIDEMQKQTERDFKGEEQQTRRLAQLDLELEILEAQTAETQRKLDKTLQLVDAGKQALESGMTKGISALIKGEESSLKDTMLKIAEGVLSSVADTLAKQMSEGLMTLMFGEKQTEAERMEIAIEEGGVKHREEIEAGGNAVGEFWKRVFDNFNAQQTQFTTESPDLRSGGNLFDQSDDYAALNQDAFSKMQTQSAYVVPEAGESGSVAAGKVSNRVDEQHAARIANLPNDQADIERMLYAQGTYNTEYLERLRGMLLEVAEWEINSDPVLDEDQKDYYRRALTDSSLHSIFTHDNGMHDKIGELNLGMDELIRVVGGEMQPGFEAAQDASNEKVAAIFEVETKETLDLQRQNAGTRADITTADGIKPTSWGQIFESMGAKPKSKMTGSAAPGSTDADGNPIGEPLKGDGFFSKLTGFFSKDAPWMTKLGDFFSGDSEFLSGLSGLFGGLGDIFGKLFGGAGGGDGWMSMLTTLFTGANGGIARGGFRKFARGGIVNSPTLGLIGEGRHNEAVVPLPDGKAIPVDMRSSSQNNNVTVNVSSDGQQESEGQDNEGLGRAIAAAVQEELQNQKRAGGILNKYGTA